ncbi:helix-turn-helix domain-containing protein [Candidatus Xianfuyuplasma coldseepsis]|uniref:Helix-turn-helix transcriptional regulator n=1 Tax=Candidatus Xianfuyuplasma coldseepsis TaxID=2782163 RepID=A0A7L7KQ48_9MOLU|nr:helix-turn-helix transcriptional regulator [Xianfuyuplasma coldseepsis]QMS84843.1 helix-turn-helix transcriptional regulator [Xianfuyuplasma coldseepsis]
MNICNNLRTLRKQKGFRQKDIAQHLDIRIQNYSRYELGDRNIPFDILERLADFYHYPVQAFFIKDIPDSDFSDLTITELGVLFDMKTYDFVEHHKRLEEDSVNKNSISEADTEKLNKLSADLISIKSALMLKVANILSASHKLKERWM